MLTFLLIVLACSLLPGALVGGIAKLCGQKFWPAALAGAAVGLAVTVGIFVWFLHALSYV